MLIMFSKHLNLRRKYFRDNAITSKIRFVFGVYCARPFHCNNINLTLKYFAKYKD